MGEIADMMLDGTLDYITGEYIGEPCGYPRSNNDDGCWFNFPEDSAKASIIQLCKNVGIRDRKRRQLAVTTFLKSIDTPRIGNMKMADQFMLVYRNHKQEFKNYLAENKHKS